MKNKTKKPFLLFSILIGFLLTISIGYSIWLITERVEIKPNLEVEKIITQYLDGQKATYTPKTIFLPSKELLGWTEGSEEIKYYYKLITDSDGNDVSDENIYSIVTNTDGPINAGTYIPLRLSI